MTPLLSKMVERVVELVVLGWLNLARPAQVLAFEIGFFKCQIIFYPSLIYNQLEF